MAEIIIGPEDTARFWKYVRRNKTTGCLEWTGGGQRGYGFFKLRGKTRIAHRVAWVMAHGPIPPGMCVCHHCDNPPCVNVLHLFLGTVLDNIRDRDAKGRQAFGARNGAHVHPERVARGDRSGPRLHPESYPRGEAHYHAVLTVALVRSLRRRAAAGEHVRTMARELGVSRNAVRGAIMRETWAHVN